MLQDLQNRTGKQGIRFLIVNGKDQASMNSAQALRERVSFPILQESPFEPIWARLRGDSGDVFVYDRCGRLAYYVPLPLSHSASGDMSAVRYAISETYDRSPCGEQCPEEQPAPTTVPPTELPDTLLHYARAVGPGQTEDEAHGTHLHGNTADNRIVVRDDSTATSAAQPTTREGLGWRVVHMFFKKRRRGQQYTTITAETGNGTASENVLEGGNHSVYLRDLPPECSEFDKTTCFDWPKELVQRLEHCCNGSLPREEHRSRNPCGTLTPRRCKKLQPLVACCRAMHMARDRLLEREYEGIIRDFDKDAYEKFVALPCSGRSI